MTDHYATLGVSRDATPEAIKAAYRRLAREHHPDKKDGDPEVMARINTAYDTLRDPEKRGHYDLTGEDGQRVPTEAEMIGPLVIGVFDRASEAAIKNMVGLGRTNLIANMVKLLDQDRDRGHEALRSIDDSVKQMKEMQRRLGFTGEDGGNIIAATLAGRIRDAGELKAKNEATLELVAKAKAHVELYGWELDPPPALQPYQDELLRSIYGRGFGSELFTVPIRPMPLNQEIRFTRRPATFEWTDKAPKRRGARLDYGKRLYVRPHTCTLDADGRQVPPPRGSWAAFERRARELVA